MSNPWKLTPILAALILVTLIGAAGCSSGDGSEGLAAEPTPVDIHCTETDPHPIGESIAQTYDVSYEQVMIWFCSGYSFDNILIAVETSEAVDVPAQTLLEMLLDKDWETIWEEVGFTEES